MLNATAGATILQPPTTSMISSTVVSAVASSSSSSSSPSSSSTTATNSIPNNVFQTNGHNLNGTSNLASQQIPTTAAQPSASGVLPNQLTSSLSKRKISKSNNLIFNQILIFKPAFRTIDWTRFKYVAAQGYYQHPEAIIFWT